MGTKLIYKKSLAVELIKCGHDFLYSARNRANKKYQVFAFTDTPELRADMARITGSEFNESIIGKQDD